MITPPAILSAFRGIFITLINLRLQDRQYYTLTPEANLMYKEWFDFKNIKYNRAQVDHINGIIAKYQDYCLRFALIIQCIEDYSHRTSSVTAKSMERAIRLTEYFLGNMHKAGKILMPETPLDKLQDNYRNLYDAVPQSFSSKSFIDLAITFDIKEVAAKVFLSRQIDKLFEKVGRNLYEKML